MSELNYFSINSTVKTYPEYPYEAIKEAVLGKKYRLSLNFIGPRRAQKLNVTYRQKTYSPNVLSFPYDDKTGEIYLCPQVALPEAKDFNLSPNGYIAFLYIHGLLHLKGYDHSAEMEALERRFMSKFNIS